MKKCTNVGIKHIDALMHIRALKEEIPHAISDPTKSCGVEDEFAKDLAKNMEALSYIRKKLEEKSAKLPEITGFVFQFGEETRVIPFDFSGENPVLWLYLCDGTSLVITAGRKLTLKRHCSDEDFENKVYPHTNGIIEEYSVYPSNLEPLTYQIRMFVNCYGLAEDPKK